MNVFWQKDSLISPPPIIVFDGLSLESVIEAYLMLEENRTNGHNLVMIINEAFPDSTFYD